MMPMLWAADTPTVAGRFVKATARARWQVFNPTHARLPNQTAHRTRRFTTDPDSTAQGHDDWMRHRHHRADPSSSPRDARPAGGLHRRHAREIRYSPRRRTLAARRNQTPVKEVTTMAKLARHGGRCGGASQRSRRLDNFAANGVHPTTACCPKYAGFPRSSSAQNTSQLTREKFIDVLGCIRVDGCVSTQRPRGGRSRA